MDRRSFLLLSLATSGTLAVGRGFVAPAFAAPAQPGESPYGPLLAPDRNGLMLPDGFRSRVIKNGLLPIAGTSTLARVFPDGAATFPTDDGGWILVSNSENPPPVDIPDPTDFIADLLGGTQAIRFAPDGTIVDAYDILSKSRSNCAGGATPWGTWLSCEEFDDPLDASKSGLVFECDPTGAAPAKALPLLGRFKHENASVDPVGKVVYETEDLPDGLFYRFVPDSYPDLTAGRLEAALVADDGSVTWLPIDDPACTGGTPCRKQARATRFDGGEGCVYDDHKVFVTTKGDDRVWMYDTVAETMVVLYDSSEFSDPVLSGVDHIIAQAGTGNLVVAEDGGNFEAVMIDRDTFSVFPVVRMTGPEHDYAAALLGELADQLLDVVPLPIASEVTGLAFNPAGDRLYLNSQRGNLLGITYEVEGPWLETLRPTPTTTSTTTTSTTAAPTSTAAPGPTLPVTGPAGTPGGNLLGIGAAGLAAAGIAATLRRRLDRQLGD